MGLSFTSPTTTVNVFVLLLTGWPESNITTGTKYCFCCSRSKVTNDTTLAAASSPGGKFTLNYMVWESTRETGILC